MATSPSKRRVLATLDVNAPSPKASANLLSKDTGTAATAAEADPRKRLHLSNSAADAEAQQPPYKRICVEDLTGQRPQQQTQQLQGMEEREAAAHNSGAPQSHAGVRQTARQPSVSPAPSSVFDSSALDTSQETTTITEPDADVPRPHYHHPAAALALGSSSRPRYTRQEVREKAEILRLRLGLANYKLRTGQTDLPLEQLELQRRTTRGGEAVPRLAPLLSSFPASSSSHPLAGRALAETRLVSSFGEVRPGSSSSTGRAAA